ncbi:MAG: Glucosamine-6-phosphate deaminase [isomerizing], alternative [uncultured Sphingosinicella sp.]|uniref:Glucosamine-6-phosphate deaminase [isomerizing], alternative n=1 Tax=uncultured Sphingosinicella sp. TaxID=478748 RepID=A0A6J4TYB2_9SPHN|nr:MAG: Glucosamine-6-phosphate deaminase [isomerizing], alternative [uncultured Sphingosinicella sp.]
MQREAAEAPAVAERQNAELAELMSSLGGRLRNLDPRLVVTCARGSSDHAATYAKYLIETRARTPVASFAPSTSSVYGTSWRKLDSALFLAISQSGRSPDLLVSAKAARDAGALVVAIVNDASSPLADIAEVTIPLLAGTERSVAATKSYIASLLAIARLVAAWTDDEALQGGLSDAPRILGEAWGLDWSPALTPLAPAANLYVLGRGLSLGIAQEAALKLKETCGLHAESYSAAEVKHGPMAIVGAGFPVMMLVPNDEARDAFEPLASDFISRGAQVMITCEAIGGALPLPFVPRLHPAIAPIASIQSFYRMAAALSIARGLHPDEPPHLKKVTETR